MGAAMIADFLDGLVCRCIGHRPLGSPGTCLSLLLLLLLLWDIHHLTQSLPRSKCVAAVNWECVRAQQL